MEALHRYFGCLYLTVTMNCNSVIYAQWKQQWCFQNMLVLCLYVYEQETCVKYYLPYQVTKNK